MSDYKLPIKVTETSNFKKEIKKLRKIYRSIDKDILFLKNQLEAGETPGDRISGNEYTVFKVRVKNSDIKKGKSGGYRVIYYTQTSEAILLTNIYSKSEKSDISSKEIEEAIISNLSEKDESEDEL